MLSREETPIATIEETLQAAVIMEEAGDPTPRITEVKGPLKLQRRLTLAITTIPFLGFLAALRLLWGGITGMDLGLLAGLYCFSIVGVTVGYHRLLTHGGFDAPTWVRVALAIAG